jgi:hypothetical protein
MLCLEIAWRVALGLPLGRLLGEEKQHPSAAMPPEGGIE